jgi:streptomycin 6-kinase
MLYFIEEAETYFNEIHWAHTPKVLLHGDFHHFNILQDSDGSWKAIDPKGIIGVAYFECGAFMENQLNMVPEEGKLCCLQEMIAVFSDKFHATKLTIVKAFFISTVLRTCWTFEENPGPEKILESVSLCRFIHNHLMLLKNNITE